MLEKVVKLPGIAKDSIDLRTPTGDDEGSYLGDFIDNEISVLPPNSAMQTNLRGLATGRARQAYA